MAEEAKVAEEADVRISQALKVLKEIRDGIKKESVQGYKGIIAKFNEQKGDVRGEIRGSFSSLARKVYEESIKFSKPVVDGIIQQPIGYNAQEEWWKIIDGFIMDVESYGSIARDQLGLAVNSLDGLFSLSAVRVGPGAIIPRRPSMSPSVQAANHVPEVASDLSKMTKILLEILPE